MGNDDYLLTEIKNAKALLEGQRESLRRAKKPQDSVSAQNEIKRQEARIRNLRFEWQSRNPGALCHV